MESTNNISILGFDDYRAALRHRADQWKDAVPKATFQKLAKACRVQRAYLSRVFQCQAELSQDQLFLACDHLGILALERDFLFTLHAYCRSDVPARRRQLADQLALLRQKDQTTLGHVATLATAAPDELEGLAPFFLDPDLQLVHSTLAIDSFAENPQSLGAALGIPVERVEQALATLRRLGLITVAPPRIRLNQQVIHLPPESPLYRPYRQLLKQRALARQDQRPDHSGYSLSLLFTASPAVEVQLRSRLLTVLREFEPEVRAAPSERLYFLGIDLFPW